MRPRLTLFAVSSTFTFRKATSTCLGGENLAQTGVPTNPLPATGKKWVGYIAANSCSMFRPCIKLMAAGRSGTPPSPPSAQSMYAAPESRRAALLICFLPTPCNGWKNRFRSHEPPHWVFRAVQIMSPTRQYNGTMPKRSSIRLVVNGKKRLVRFREMSKCTSFSTWKKFSCW